MPKSFLAEPEEQTLTPTGLPDQGGIPDDTGVLPPDQPTTFLDGTGIPPSDQPATPTAEDLGGIDYGDPPTEDLGGIDYGSDVPNQKEVEAQLSKDRKTAEDRDEGQRHYEEANNIFEELQSRDLDDVRDIEERSFFPRLWSRVGDDRINFVKRSLEAESAYEKAYELDPTNYRALQKAAVIADERGDQPKHRELLARASKAEREKVIADQAADNVWIDKPIPAPVLEKDALSTLSDKELMRAAKESGATIGPTIKRAWEGDEKPHWSDRRDLENAVYKAQHDEHFNQDNLGEMIRDQGESQAITTEVDGLFRASEREKNSSYFHGTPVDVQDSDAATKKWVDYYDKDGKHVTGWATFSGMGLLEKGRDEWIEDHIQSQPKSKQEATRAYWQQQRWVNEYRPQVESEFMRAMVLADT